MPRSVVFTGEAVSASHAGVTFIGERLLVRTTFPTPNDDTAEAAAFRPANLTKEIGVKMFTNVRFGLSPTGARRFLPCVRYDQPAGVYAATGMQPIPHQTYFEEHGTDGRPGIYGTGAGVYNWPALGTRESEDVLFYSVFVPETPGPHPCRFHIRGGGWGVYHAMAPQQFGAMVAANTGCVVILPEYRNSTFGHLPHPAFNNLDEPSPAYTDIKTGLHHAYDYADWWEIDRTKIIVSGTSAGGAAVLMLLEDDEAQGWFTSYFVGSGGGTAPYLTEQFHRPRSLRFAQAFRIAAPFLQSMAPAFRTVQDAIDANGLVWAMQHALRPEHVQAMADIGPTVTAASVKAAIAETGDLVTSRRTEPENFYPFLRGDYPNAIEMAKAGKIRKPGMILYAECEALGLLGFDYTSIRDALLALPTATLNGWAQRLGYASYAAWLGAAWMPVGGLQTGPGAQFNPAFGDAVVIANPDLEARRVLYTQAVFGYAAWRIARAATENGQVCYLVVNNFSPNSIWAGHSQEVSLAMGNPEWVVGSVTNFPSATPPGEYPSNYMDGLYVSEILQRALANLAATGSPNVPSGYEGFDQFDGITPADGGSLAVTWVPYDLADPGYANVIGKHFVGEPYFLNGGQFFEGGALDLKSQRDARVQYLPWMADAMSDYRARLEP